MARTGPEVNLYQNKCVYGLWVSISRGPLEERRKYPLDSYNLEKYTELAVTDWR
jgi:hypothetical protein